MGQQPRGWKLKRVDVDPFAAPDEKHTTTQEALEAQLQEWIDRSDLDPQRICRITAPAVDLPWYRNP
jgi:hypothetical protein